MAEYSDTHTIHMDNVRVDVAPGNQNAHSCVDMHKADRRRYLMFFMPIIIVLALLVFILAILTGYYSGRASATNAARPKSTVQPTSKMLDFSSRNGNLDGEWIKYKSHFSKVYPNVTEDRKRRMIWEDNLRFIQQHNIEYSRGMHTHILGLNRFSDLTNAEFQRQYSSGGCLQSKTPTGGKKFSSKHTFRRSISEFNWRAAGKVSPIKNQKRCGSCWAFSAAAAIESHYAIKYKTRARTVSEQQLVDCSRSFGNNGCKGGFPSSAFKYVIGNSLGIVNGTCYPYTQRDGACRINKLPRPCEQKSKAIQLDGFVPLPAVNETLMMEALYEFGPLSVGVHVDQKHFKNYPEGGLVLDPPDCSKRINHAVLIVGFGVHYNVITGRSVNYWLIKNSWGRSWGDMGYFKLVRGKNACGVANLVTFPIIK